MEESIIAGIDFNRDDDKKEYGRGDRIIRLLDEDNKIYFSFELGRRDDDTISLTFDRKELSCQPP